MLHHGYPSSEPATVILQEQLQSQILLLADTPVHDYAQHRAYKNSLQHAVALLDMHICLRPLKSDVCQQRHRYDVTVEVHD